MLVWKEAQEDGWETYSLEQVYRLIRRKYLVVPFEAHPFEIAMLRAFSAMKGATPQRTCRASLLGEMFLNLSAGVSALRLQLRLFAADFQLMLKSHTALAEHRHDVQPPLGCGLGMGFFSACKPNLRNTP